MGLRESARSKRGVSTDSGRKLGNGGHTLCAGGRTREAGFVMADRCLCAFEGVGWEVGRG